MKSFDLCVFDIFITKKGVTQGFMKTIIRNVIYSLFIVTLFIILYDAISTALFSVHLNNSELPLKKGTNMFKLANSEEDVFIKSQKKAVNNRITNVSLDLLRTIMYVAISMIFLNGALQRKSMKAANSSLTLIRNNYRELKRSEINFFCIFTGLYLLAKMILFFAGKRNLDSLTIFKQLTTFTLTYFFIIPFAMFLVYLALNLFGRQFIIACYLAYLIKVLPEILIHDKPDFERMRLVNINKFDDKIQTLLIKYGLKDRVYEEIKPSRDKNAALVGYGRGIRLEIYGDIGEMNSEYINAIILHEIGHADDNSLAKKTIAYVFVILLEMCIALWFFTFANAKFSNNNISIFTSFLILMLIYKMLLRQYVFVIYKLASQYSEIKSDNFAKKHGYGAELATALYDIVVEYGEYTTPTRLYTMIRSTHPPLSSRVNSLV
ncbi:Zn-dependent protease [Spraguea lophii 42_110]|uniref:Zn-dependent protease n=1 Tax=Spraguea lophii (strain 42_110) TaxID=1358809 RepID=S7W5G5_SPRLO|nr:Zn-dependent protease [Spraguea lophii 42_110]